MGLVERLSELESMRQSGQISDSEYAMLVASATKRFGEDSASIETKVIEALPAKSQTPSQSVGFRTKSKLIVVSLVLVLIVATFVFSRGGTGEVPTASNTSDLLIGPPETVSSEDSMNAFKLKRENSAKACREIQAGQEGPDYEIRFLFALRDRINEGLGRKNSKTILYEDAENLKTAKKWISWEMEPIVAIRDLVSAIDRPEFANEKSQYLSLLKQIETRQIYLLAAQSWPDFLSLSADYQVLLRELDNESNFLGILQKLCKG